MILPRILRGGRLAAVAVIGLGVLADALAPASDGSLLVVGGRIVWLGLLFLLLTPVASVAAASLDFARHGERRYAWIGAGVLALLAASLAGGVLIGLGGGG